MTAEEQRLKNFGRNNPEVFAVYATLPKHAAGDPVRCPTHNPDGTPIADDDVPGCGSDNVTFAGDGYDCHDCGIFFADYAARPPHGGAQE